MVLCIVLSLPDSSISFKIHSRHVACRPQSRDGSGINSADVHKLLDDVLTTGFVLDCVNCLSRQMRPMGPKDMWTLEACTVHFTML